MRIQNIVKLPEKLRPVVNNLTNPPISPDFPRLFVRKAPQHKPSSFSFMVRDAITYLMEHTGFISWR